MSKEYLEALNELWNIARNDEFGYNGRTEKQCNEFNNKLLELKNIIEKALQRLEAIENVKPSEAMGCLESMSNEKALFRSILSRSTVYMGREQIDDFSYKSTIGNEFKGAIETIKQALLELKAIKEANPSEALELVGYLKDHHLNTIPYYDWLNDIEKYILKAQEQEKENSRAFGKDIINLNKTLKQTIDKPILYASRYGNKYIVPQKLFEEQEKVLEIIKEKGLPLIERDMIKQSKDYDEYNIKYSWCNLKNASIQKTEEEFELLKETLV